MCNYVIVSLKACGLIGFCRFSGCAEEKRHSVHHACVRYKCHQCARESWLWAWSAGAQQAMGSGSPCMEVMLTRIGSLVSLSSVSAAVCIVFGGSGGTNVVGMPCLWEEEASG